MNPERTVATAFGFTRNLREFTRDLHEFTRNLREFTREAFVLTLEPWGLYS